MSKKTLRIIDSQVWDAHIQNKDERWELGRNKAIKNMGPGEKGAFLENFVKEIYKLNGHKVEDRSSKGHDVIIDGKKIEVKGATCIYQKDDSRKYMINQIRPNNDYEYLIFVLVDPDGYRIYEAKKEDYSKPNYDAHIKYQHNSGKVKSSQDDNNVTLMATIHEEPTFGNFTYWSR